MPLDLSRWSACTCIFNGVRYGDSVVKRSDRRLIQPSCSTLPSALNAAAARRFIRRAAKRSVKQHIAGKRILARNPETAAIAFAPYVALQSRRRLRRISARYQIRDLGRPPILALYANRTAAAAGQRCAHKHKPRQLKRIYAPRIGKQPLEFGTVVRPRPILRANAFQQPGLYIACRIRFNRALHRSSLRSAGLHSFIGSRFRLCRFGLRRCRLRRIELNRLSLRRV